MTKGITCTEEGYKAQARLREDELMALEAILPSTDLGHLMALSASGSSNGEEIWLSVPAVLPGPTTVVVRSHYLSSEAIKSRDGEKLQSGLGSEHMVEADNVKCRTEMTTLESICHLPPLKLLLRLPQGYPCHQAPIIVQIVGDIIQSTSRQDQHHPIGKNRQARARASASSESWRSIIVNWLRDTLLKQWQEFQGEILYTWYEYLKESLWQELLASSSVITSPLLQGSPPTLTLEEFLIEEQDVQVDQTLATMLKAHDILRKRKEFEGERFGCGICLEDKRGGKCYKIAACSHVFCQDCLSSYLSSMIREGYIRQASACPDPECVKARVAAENKEAAATEHTIKPSNKNEAAAAQVGAISSVELLLFVGPNLVARLEDLREKALASIDPSAGYCPRPGCEKLVRGDSKDIGTMYESIRMCECGFIYCLYCNKAWHGKSPCNLLSSTALIERYQKALEGSTLRREMEMRYGKSNLERMVRNHEEETQNRAYIESNTQKCPCCSVRIEKSFGCNHMTCRSCNTHLCYLCGTRLNPNEPYRHFNTLGTNCFQKLFDVITGAGGPPEDWGFQAAREDDLAQWEAEL